MGWMSGWCRSLVEIDAFHVVDESRLAMPKAASLLTLDYVCFAMTSPSSSYYDFNCGASPRITLHLCLLSDDGRLYIAGLGWGGL